jgi:hypothetical protein
MVGHGVGDRNRSYWGVCADCPTWWWVTSLVTDIADLGVTS